MDGKRRAVGKITVTMLLVTGLLGAMATTANAYAFPSTNELNKARLVPGHEGQLAPYVEQASVGAGTTTLHFVGGYVGLACFEYRIDGVAKISGNPHPVVTGDYIYPNFCVDANLTGNKTFTAGHKVEIRLALGAERDWDFDWTTFSVPTYDDVSLTGGFDAGHFGDVWDVTECPLTLSATVDLNGLSDAAGAHAWAELGVRTYGYGDFNPTWDAEGAGVWLATDYDWTTGTFGPDVSPTLDPDDKLILQKAGGHGEGDYDLPSVPPAPGASHRFWWDRDGVDPWQNGETANTNGIYDVVISLTAGSATTGTAYMMINGLDQGFETDGNWTTIELTPAGMTFTGDMAHQQVFYGLYGYGASHSVAFRNITVDGCRNQPPTVDADGPYTVVAGGSVQVSATGTDPEGYPLVYEWDLDNDGTFETPGQTATFSAGSVGTYTVVARVTDPGGQSASDEASVGVIYAFDGFYRPVDNEPVFNVVKAGQAIPVQFSLGGDQGLDIFAAGYPTATAISCGALAGLDAVEQTVTASTSSLHYDPATDTYTYVWKTLKTWAGTCQRLNVTLVDGTSHLAYFSFTK